MITRFYTVITIMIL